MESRNGLRNLGACLPAKAVAPIVSRRFESQDLGTLDFYLRVDPHHRVSDGDIFDEVLQRDQYLRERTVPRVGTIVDVGAHIGFFSLMAARLASAARVIAFEPEPGNFELLSKNIARNAVANVTAVRRAVWSRKEGLTLGIQDWNSGAHSAFLGGSSLQTVECTTMEDLLAELGTIDLLKLDCEGAEFPILLEMPEHVFNYIGGILMEVHEFSCKDFPYTRKDLDDLLQRQGFSISVFERIEYPGEGRFSILWATRAPGA